LQKQHLEAFAGRMEALSQTIDTQLARNRESSEKSAMALREESAKRMSEFSDLPASAPGNHARTPGRHPRRHGKATSRHPGGGGGCIQGHAREENANSLKKFGDSLETGWRN
jgi:hypothetical protein